jgi:hypothetical protein
MEPVATSPPDPTVVFRELNSKFSANLAISLTQHSQAFEMVEIRARAIAAVGSILATQSLTPFQCEIAGIANEIFADVICSIYLAGCALDNAAKIVLRRAFELGIATVYLWDLPHVFCDWKEHDHDLSFSEMVKHIESPGYKSFVRRVNTKSQDGQVIDAARCQHFYGCLSDTVHGKICTLESILPARFSQQVEDWRAYLDLVTEGENILLDLWKARFPQVSDELCRTMPQLARI